MDIAVFVSSYNDYKNVSNLNLMNTSSKNGILIFISLIAKIKGKR